MPHRVPNLTVALGLGAMMIVGCARLPQPHQPVTNVASAASACEAVPLRSQVERLREMEQRAHTLLVDTATYARLQLQLERVLADTALHARLERLMADTALTQHLEDARIRFQPRADSLSMRLDSLLACLSRQSASPSR